MKKIFALLIGIVGLLTACQTTESPSSHSTTEEDKDSAAIYQEWAYQEMFADSLRLAEAHAYRAFMLSQDSVLQCDALSLLCYIYYREGKQKDLQLLMQTISPDVYINVMDVQLRVEQVKAGRQQQYLLTAIIVLLLSLSSLGLWYVRRMQSLKRLYRQRMAAVRQELGEERLRLSEMAASETTERPALEIGETKMGIDVLFAIINDQNISQMGKREEQAVLKILPMVDAALAAALQKASSPLTPKETFFCIMEYYGKTDKQKARSFCCSEQAVRSTKSRLRKKLIIDNG